VFFFFSLNFLVFYFFLKNPSGFLLAFLFFYFNFILQYLINFDDFLYF
jgi:hypothetical protein